MLPDELQQPRLTIEHRREAGDWLFVVYSWDRDRDTNERVRQEIATFRSIEQAAKEFPLAVMRGSFCSGGNPVRFGPYACPKCGGFYYSMEWNIPLVYLCAICRATI